jgi:hypothetical protein
MGSINRFFQRIRGTGEQYPGTTCSTGEEVIKNQRDFPGLYTKMGGGIIPNAT